MRQNRIQYKKKFLKSGLEAALHEAPRPGRPIEIDERIRCEIASYVCSKPPHASARWTLDLIVERLGERGFGKISRESVRLVLHDHELKPWQVKSWCIPEINDEFVKRMDDVLDIYERPYDSSNPVICLDEKPVHLLKDYRDPIQTKSGEPRRVDYDYERNGQANVFVAIEPKTGELTTKTTETRDGIEFSRFIGNLSQKYDTAEKIILVMDNLSTHAKSSLIRAYGQQIGQEVWDRFEVHHTPVHASWLNQAELAIGMVQRRCLGKNRIANTKVLAGKVRVWTTFANKKPVKINWKFTKEKAHKDFNLDR